MDKQKILKVSDSEIITASLDQGRAIFAGMEQTGFADSEVDSIARLYHARIRWLAAGTSESLEVENQMIEAYVIGAETGSTQDNIQQLRRFQSTNEYDSLLYTRPIMTTLEDGVVKVEGVWNIYLAKKDVILLLGKEH